MVQYADLSEPNSQHNPRVVYNHHVCRRPAMYTIPFCPCLRSYVIIIIRHKVDFLATSSLKLNVL